MPQSPLYDEKILFACIAKADEAAFRILFDAYKEKLAVFVLQIIHSKADAEEIVQELFFKLWKAKNNLAAVDHPKNYLYTMARNQALDLLQKMARDRHLQEQLWINHSHMDNKWEGTENWLQARESEKLIYQALAQLPLKKQQIFQLRRQQGLKPQEIADKMGMSLSRVKNALTEVINYLKNFLDKHSVSLFFALSLKYFS